MLAVQGTDFPLDLVRDPLRLLRVGFRHRVDDWSVDALFGGHVGQRTRLRRQTRAAKAGSRRQVCPTYACVQADPVDDHGHVRSGCGREAGKLVGEAGLQPKEDVGAGLDQLRGCRVGHEDWRADIEVDALQQGQCPGLRLRPGQAHDDSIRSQKVTYGVALACELRIDRDFDGWINVGGEACQARGLGRHERAAHDDRPGRLLIGYHVGQSALYVACTPIAALIERADAKKYRIRPVAERGFARKAQAAVGRAIVNGILEAGLKEGQDSLLQAFDAFHISVDATNVEAERRQTSGCDKSHVSGAQDREIERLVPCLHAADHTGDLYAAGR